MIEEKKLTVALIAILLLLKASHTAAHQQAFNFTQY